ncbi:MAG: DUF5697 family protein [Clostridiales bacterium]|nr:DUF5697 family protein [Clostridiales bacterium]
MRHYLLIDNILDFVNEFGLVHEDQVTAFYRKEFKEEESIKWSLQNLVSRHKLVYDGNTNTYSTYNLHLKRDPTHQRLLTKSAWIMSAFQPQDVRSINALSYPLQLAIITNDDVMFDVTVIEKFNENTVFPHIKRVLGGTVDDEYEQKIVHIAMVNDDDKGQECKKYGFDCYCILKSDNSLSIVNF